MSVVVSVNLIRVAIHWNIFRSIRRLELAHCNFALIHRSVLMGCRAARAARAMHSVASVAYIGYRFLHSPSHFTIKIQVTHFVCTTRTEWINKYTELEQRVNWMLAVHRILQMATDTKLKWQVWTEHGVWIHRALDIFGLLPTLGISTDFKPVFPPTSNSLIPNSAGSGKPRTFRAQVARYRYQCTVFSNCIPPKKSPNTPNISKRAWFQWKTRRCNSNAIFHLHRNGAAAARTEWLFHVIIAPNILRLSLIPIEIDTDQ